MISTAVSSLAAHNKLQLRLCVEVHIDKAEQEDADASLHWTRGDYTARAVVEGQRACQRASGLYQSAEAYGG
jgi:hypothetical protein